MQYLLNRDISITKDCESFVMEREKNPFFKEIIKWLMNSSLSDWGAIIEYATRCYNTDQRKQKATNDDGSLVKMNTELLATF